MNLQLRIDIIDQNSDGDSIATISTVRVSDSAKCESFYFNLDTYSVLDYAGRELFKCDPNKIKKLEIFLYGEQGYPIFLNINNFDFISCLSAGLILFWCARM